MTSFDSGKIVVRITLFVTLSSIVSAAAAGPYTSKMNKACPNAWTLTDKPVPEVDPASNYWAVGGDDKSEGRDHIDEADVIVTIDDVPVTTDELIDDNLTVASECLVYRNLEYQTYDYATPPSVPANVTTGWMPAIF
ncbi:MAG: hypothetical protein AAF431_01165 [Pseudomonadota bacterium]